MLIFINSHRNKREHDFEVFFPKLWKALRNPLCIKKSFVLSFNVFFHGTLEE